MKIDVSEVRVQKELLVISVNSIKGTAICFEKPSIRGRFNR